MRHCVPSSKWRDQETRPQRSGLMLGSLTASLYLCLQGCGHGDPQAGRLKIALRHVLLKCSPRAKVQKKSGWAQILRKDWLRKCLLSLKHSWNVCVCVCLC